MSDTVKSADRDKHPKLTPLTAEYLEAEHGGYVKTINEALENKEICNIALSGSYGVGKSSILQKVAKLKGNRVVELSLSTLAPIAESSLDDTVPEQATTTTNRIQQEIVKQLLYRQKPNKAPGSRFRRIERFSWLRELAIGCPVGIAVALIFLLTGWTEQIATVFTPLIDLGLWAHVVTLGLAVSMTVFVRRLLHGRIHIRQLSAGSASVTLDDKSVSYFDQYLDEIVYFFEMSKCDIVIFEDIDRFNDSRIFETLRSLNTLLNRSPQKSKTIRFIYAIKDSIFDRIGLELEGRTFEQDRLAIEDPAQAEAFRANRTKFFDLVIPVVPFITHRSARNLATQILKEIEHDVDLDLIDLAARHVPDMRLLKNVRNEFLVFRDRIFSGDGEHLDLCQTDLFAMMLYKSTHLTDFESIRIGKSKLDELYETGRKLVGSNVERLEREIRAARRRLEQLDSVADRSSTLGKRLIEHVECTVSASPWRNSGNISRGQYTLNGKQKTQDELETPAFWSEFVQSDTNPTLYWSPSSQPNQKFSFSRSNIATALGTSLDPKSWNESDREKLNATLAEYREDLKFLRQADMGDLIKRSDFQVEYNSPEQSLDSVARELLTAGLAYQLIRAGYINRNFTLYTSTFHGDRVSPAATNFLIHHIDRNVMDEHFELEDADVKAVIREKGKKALGDKALYNIAILDHLLRNDVNAAKIMIQSLADFGDDQMRFMQAYLNSGSERLGFVKQLTAMSSRVLVYLISQAELDDTDRLAFVNVALESLVEDVNYQTDSEVSAYLKECHAELSALTSTLLNEYEANRIGTVFADANIRVPALAPLSETVLEAFVTKNLYVINRENLKIALGDNENLGLDVALKANHGVYNYIVGNLDAYLAAIDGFSPTVSSDQDFISVLEDVLNDRSDRLDEIIAHASESCIVKDLKDVSEDAWPHLAHYQRFPAKFSNVSAYISAIGSLDGNLANVLTSTRRISDLGDYDEDSKTELAKVILSAREHIPSTSLRVELVTSLNLHNYLEVDELHAENGDVFGLLLKHKIIEDNSDTFAHLLEFDWPTRECFINESSQFHEYMSPGLVQSDLARLLQSNMVNDAIKTTVAEHASEYTQDSSKKDLAQLAQYAIQQGIELTIDVVEKLASNGVPPHYVIRSLVPHLETITSDQLFHLLQSLDGDYPKLTSVGRDQPKVPNTPADCALLDVLTRHGIVKTYDAEANPIKVNKRRK